MDEWLDGGGMWMWTVIGVLVVVLLVVVITTLSKNGSYVHDPVVKRTVKHERTPMLVKVSTDKTITETAAALQVSVQANGFGVMQVHNLKETMAKKGVQFGHECLIFEVCQPEQAQKVLDNNISVSTALPCRISIYEENGKTILAALKPTTLLALFNSAHLEAVAQEVEDTIVKIMQEAALV